MQSNWPNVLVSFSVKANDAWQLGDEVASKHHAKKAKIFVILGILVGLATYALAFSLYFTIGTETHKVHNSGFTGWHSYILCHETLHNCLVWTSYTVLVWTCMSYLDLSCSFKQ